MSDRPEHIAVIDNKLGAHLITLDAWKFSVDTLTGRLFRVSSGPGVGPHGLPDPPLELTTLLATLDAGDWSPAPQYYYRVNLNRLIALTAEKADAGASTRDAVPEWLTPMKASGRGPITTADIVELWKAISVARKTRGDLDGAHRAALAAYGARVADATRWRDKDTTESFRKRILGIKRPQAPRRRRSAR
ncbi:hypothetical protein [Cryptosporangium sp. NPDC048952]|uniref:hypothetical protein n=1 Tax=Cryptosporangium sp. NPDC048952 TaxID=3363961 RepID=UPI00370FC023